MREVELGIIVDVGELEGTTVRRIWVYWDV